MPDGRPEPTRIDRRTVLRGAAVSAGTALTWSAPAVTRVAVAGAAGSLDGIILRDAMAWLSRGDITGDSLVQGSVESDTTMYLIAEQQSFEALSISVDRTASGTAGMVSGVVSSFLVHHDRTKDGELTGSVEFPPGCEIVGVIWRNTSPNQRLNNSDGQAGLPGVSYEKDETRRTMDGESYDLVTVSGRTVTIASRVAVGYIDEVRILVREI